MIKIGSQLQAVLLSLLLIFSSVSVDSAHAQEAEKGAGSFSEPVVLGTITVTSEKREKDVQIIPSSVTVVNETQIDDFQLEDTLDLISIMPNFYVVEMFNNGGQNIASLRGVASGADRKLTLGVYVDDVPYYGLDFSLFDIERVEVLRGPQGTLYGRNSEAGVINIITKKPSSVLEGNVRLEGGSFNSYGVKGALSGPILGDRLGFKAALRYFETDGYFKNRYDGSDEAGREEILDGRLTFTAAPTDKLDLTLTADFQDYESPEYANFAPLDASDMRKAVNVDYPGKSEKDARGVSLRAEYQFGGMKLVSITSARNEEFFLSNDVDFMPTDMMTFDWGYDVTFYAQEFRLVSDRPESSLQWLSGVFLFYEKFDEEMGMWMNFMNMGMGVPGETLLQKSNVDTKSAALFGEIIYSFDNGLALTLGLRYDREQVDFDYSQQPSGPMLAMMGYPALASSNDDTFDAWLPKAALSYRFSENIMPYFIVSRGYRAGGFNTVSEKVGTSYDPEFSWNYELGAKTTWLDNRLHLNAALFYIERDNMLVDVIASDGYSSYIDNAAKASSRGVEVELMARPVRGLDIVASAAYTDAQYEDYAMGNNNYDGNTVLYSPEYTASLGVTYRFPNGIFLNAKYNYIGEMYYDVANIKPQGDYGLFDAKVGYETERFDIYVYGRNLFDKEYSTRTMENMGVWYGRAGAPQTFGVILQGRF